MTSHEADDGLRRRDLRQQSGRRRRSAAPKAPKPPKRERRAVARDEAIDARVSAFEGKTVDRSFDRRRAPVRVLGTVLLVPALIGTVALPAYAFMPGGGGLGDSGLFDLTQAEAQKVDVSGLVTDAPIASDGYSVVTAEDIERQRQAEEDAAAAQWAASLASRAGAGAFAIYADRVEGDDYPWWDQLTDDYGGGLSPLGYYFRECVDFVAWRLNRDHGSTSAPFWFTNHMSGTGSAYSWADAWVRNGWPTSSEPVVGAVAWFPANHVAYVQAVPGDGTVVVEEYNWGNDHQYNRRTMPVGDALYLYPPS